MKIAELVNFSGEMLKRLHEAGIKIDDYKYLKLYQEYKAMKTKGYKTVFAVAKLSEKYKTSERQVYYVVKRFEANCKTPSSE